MKTIISITILAALTTVMSCAGNRETNNNQSKGGFNSVNDTVSYSQITDTMQQVSDNKKFMVFLRIKNCKDYTLTQIIKYNFQKETDTLLVQGSEERPDRSTAISYGVTANYPFDGLGTIEKIELSSLNNRIYFQTTAWTVCPAVHYYDLNTGETHYFTSGWLIKIFKNGTLNIQKTEIEMSETGESNGRYVQEWLYDSNGMKIKELSDKKFE